MAITRSKEHAGTERPTGNVRQRVRTGSALLLTLVVVGAGLLTVPRAAGAVAPTGAVYAWFDDDAGQYCNGTITVPGSNHDSSNPVPTLLPASTAVAAGQSHTMAVTSTGGVDSCGFNGRGQLGNGTTTNSFTPVAASLPPGVVATQVAAGWDSSLALTSTGALYSWGRNTFGEVGDGTTKQRTSPVLVHLPTGTVVTAIAAGQYFDLAVTSTGAVFAWGYNGFGQLGDGTTTQRPLPVQVHLPTGVKGKSVGCGDNHGLVVTNKGVVYAFGKNTFGQLGNGNTNLRTLPIKVLLPTGVVATQVAAGGISPTAKVAEGDYSLAVTSTGAVYAWGANAQGQLGDGTTTGSDVPVRTQLPTGAVATQVGAGPNYGHALIADGNVDVWGSKANGKDQHLLPTPVVLPTGLHGAVVSAGPDGEQIAGIFVP